MGLFDAVRRTIHKPTPASQARVDAPQPAPSPEPLIVPEAHAVDLIPAYRAGSAPQLLDCREPFEWRQVRIPGSLHIPMNQIPGRLGELDRDRAWVVVCAHGNRSLAVAGFLIERGFKASSLAGGVTDWYARGGDVESDFSAPR